MQPSHVPVAARSLTPAGVDRRALAEAFMDLVPGLRRRIERGLPDDVREELATVTAHQLEALVCMAASDGVSMNDLARAQKVGLSSCTALADRLVRQGLAVRRPAPQDRRVVRLVPTDRALRFVDRYREARRRGAEEMLSVLGDDEAVTFVALVRKLAGGEAPPPCTGATS